LQGAQGPQGPAGPSDAYLATSGALGIPKSTDVQILKVVLPAGEYALDGTANFFDVQNDAGVDCALNVNGTFSSRAWGKVEERESLPFVGAVSLPNGGTVDVTCATGDDNLVSQSAQLVALKVGALH
jgi:hypothetical protein